MSAGGGRAGHVLLGPGNLDLDSIVKFPSLFHMNSSCNFFDYRFDSYSLLYQWSLTSVALLSTSDISQSCAPLGRSMFTMTPISDHALFIYGGLGTDGNTLSKHQSVVLLHLTQNTFCYIKTASWMNYETDFLFLCLCGCFVSCL